MHYIRKVTDLETGEVRTVSIGEHLTFTEAAQRFNVARTSLIKVLLLLGVCQREFDPVAGEYRNRLHPEAQKKGLGYRILGPHGPFDVLAPSALVWIEADLKAFLAATTLDRATITALQALDAFDANRLHRLDVEGKARWLTDHFPGLPVRQVAKGLGVSERLVHRYLTRRERQIAEKRKRLREAVGGLSTSVPRYSDPSQDFLPLAA